MQALIAGAGAIGSKLAIYLSQRGEDVTVIEKDREKCEWLSKNSDARVYNGSMLDPELLMEAGIEKTDALIIALGNDQLTRKVADFAKSQFAVPRVLAIAKESEFQDLIRSSGADKVICSQDEVLNQVENLLQTSASRTIYRDKQGNYLITQVSVRATSKALGKNPAQLQSKSAKVSGIFRSGNLLFPDQDTQLEMGDELFVMGKEESVNKIVDAVVEEG